MSPFKKVFAAAGFAALGYAPSALAEDILQTSTMSVVKAAGQDDMNYQAFYMQETVNNDLSTVRGRAFVDRAIGVTCAWKDVGRSVEGADGNFSIVGRKPEQISCVQSVKIPEKWTVAQDSTVNDARVETLLASGVDPADEEQVAQFEKAMKETTGTVLQSKSDMSVFRELIDADNPHGIPGMQIMHTWNIATNQVCLDTLEEPEEPGHGDQTEQKLGCFPITNNSYLEKVLKSGGVSPS